MRAATSSSTTTDSAAARYTYAEVGARRAASRRACTRSALRKGDKVVFWSENRPEWIVAFWGCLLRGIVVVPIDYRASPDFLARVARIVAAKLVLIGQDVPPFSAAIDAPVWKLHELDWRGAAGAGDDPPARRHRAATTSPRSSSRPARRPSRKASSSPTATCSRTSCRSSARSCKYRKWGTPFFPLRFLNLLPLSHMFGQAMATFIPPMLPGVVVFMRGYNPGEIVEQIKKRRISVLVSVPKILDVLREHVMRTFPAESGEVSERLRDGRKEHFTRRWWRYRKVHRAFGLKFWAFVVGAAPLDGGARGVLGRARLRRHPGLRPDRDRADRHAEPSVRHEEGLGRQGDRRRRGEDRAGRRDPRARRERHHAATSTRPRRRRARSRTAGSTPATSARSATDGQLYIRGRKKEMIVTPEGLNVFPEDVERVLNGDSRRARLGGRRRADRIGRARPRGPGARTRGDADADAVVRQANASLDDHQKIRRALVWPEPELPRTEGTRKLKRAAIRDWVKSGGATPRLVQRGQRRARGAAREVRRAATDLVAADDARGAGLSSLERVELMVALEDAFQTRIDEGAFSEARNIGRAAHARRARRGQRRAAGRAGRLPVVDAIVAGARGSAASACRPGFCRWRACSPGCASRAASTSSDLEGPVIFAANHQSHMDGPVIMAALPRALALPRRAGDGEGVLRGAFLPGGARPRRRGSPTASTTTSRRCSSTRSRCRSARRARGRRCATSASCSRTASRC